MGEWKILGWVGGAAWVVQCEYGSTSWGLGLFGQYAVETRSHIFLRLDPHGNGAVKMSFPEEVCELWQVLIFEKVPIISM